MESALSFRVKSPLHPHQNPFLNSPNSPVSNSIPSFRPSKPSTVKIKASSGAAVGTPNNPVIQILKLTARAIVISAAAAAAAAHLQNHPARADPVPQPPAAATEPETPADSPLPGLLDANPDAMAAVKALLQEKLEAGEDEEGLKLLRTLISAQPKNQELRFLMARLLNEMGELESARDAFEAILSENPLAFDALFENALLMDKCGEGEAVIRRLQQALEIAEGEQKAKEARDVRLIMAQVQFLQKNIEGALQSYDQLVAEDPNDFRPYFCKGMIYSLMDRNSEAKVQFAKYRELSPKKFEVEGYLRTPLSRMKLFGSDDRN